MIEVGAGVGDEITGKLFFAATPGTVTGDTLATSSFLLMLPFCPPIPALWQDMLSAIMRCCSQDRCHEVELLFFFSYFFNAQLVRATTPLKAAAPNGGHALLGDTLLYFKLLGFVLKKELQYIRHHLNVMACTFHSSATFQRNNSGRLPFIFGRNTVASNATSLNL